MKKLLLITHVFAFYSCKKDVRTEVSFETMQAQKVNCETCKVYMQKSNFNEQLAFNFCYNYCIAIKKLRR